MMIIRRNFIILAIFHIGLVLDLITPIFSIEEADLFSEGHTQFKFKDDGRIDVPLPSPIRFFNKTHSSITISGNGVVGFGAGIGMSNSASCRIAGQPNPDHQMIMGFWRDSYESIGAKLTYMGTSSSTLLQKAKRDITVAFPDDFNGTSPDLTWLFIVTWKDLGPCCSNTSSVHNTFQLILAKSEAHSFVLLYYPKIEWSNGIDWSAGFDFGGRRPLHRISSSCTADFQNITKESNIGEPGKWVFGVEADLKSPGMKIQTEKIQDVQEPLVVVQPSVVSIMGNVPIFIHGTGFRVEPEANVTITCSFRDISRTKPSETSGILIKNENGDDGNQTIICPSPFFYSLGRMEINLLLRSSGVTTFHQAYINVVKEYKSNSFLYVKFNQRNGSTLLLTAKWNQHDIQSETLDNFRESLEILLLGFQRNSWKEIQTLAEPLITCLVRDSP